MSHYAIIIIMYSTLSLVMLRVAPASIRIPITSACPFSDADIRAVHENCVLCFNNFKAQYIH